MNANDTLTQYTCTNNYYKYLLGMLLTDGALELAKRYKCFWLLDVICSYQPELKDQDFQVWELKKYEDDSCLVRCTDGNDKQLKSQTIEYTDFEATSATLWVENGVIYLPSER